MLKELSISMKSHFVNEMMQFCVKKSYDANNYVKVYRHNREATPFEKKILTKFIHSMQSASPFILDIGCGTGKPYDEFLINNDCIVTGIDFCKKHIEEAKSNIAGGTFICSNFLKYDFTEKYDGIVMLYSLFHIHRESHFDFLSKLYHSLKDNGKVLLNVREESRNLKFKKEFCGKPMYWSHYDFETFKSITKKIGFQHHLLGDEKRYGSTESHLWIILKK
jgi:2-polyprenyl-3-methyl-5-hydroxy-6-metoxy-1,4-benzoquinol methylase